MKARVALAAAALAAMSVVPVTPARAADSDCRIFGPAYVSEVVDCVVFLYTTLIDPPAPGS